MYKYDDKSKKLFCACNSNFTKDDNKYELYCPDIEICKVCTFNFWIRLNKKEK